MSVINNSHHEFLKVAASFHLGVLPTEIPHPDTHDMSNLSQQNITKALAILKKIDADMLSVLATKIPDLVFLAEKIKATFTSGGKVFLCGCGATGRLSLSLETLWRQQPTDAYLQNSVISFMAGGDVAIIKSIENFEDKPEFGARQLQELGFSEKDLLISCTEGGETPFVIGATECASQISRQFPFFLYCNPDNILCKHVERSRNVIENKNIHKINLTVGSMALSGSTRMQASSILMCGVGLALFNNNESKQLEKIQNCLENFSAFWKNLDISFLENFIKQETDIYQKQNRVIYETDVYGITVLTDTTERSPTFSLIPFENNQDTQAEASLCYLCLPAAKNTKDAWELLFGRIPRPLEWENIEKIAGLERLFGFDISAQTRVNRKRKLPGSSHTTFSITKSTSYMNFNFDLLKHQINITNLSLLEEHLLLKMLLNMHSTLVMGRLGRYSGNIMTWVRPSNFKLIDRSIRYITLLLEQEGITHLSYNQIAEHCLQAIEELGSNEPVVLKVLQKIKTLK